MSHRDKFSRDALFPYGLQIGGDPSSACSYVTYDSSGQPTMAGTARNVKTLWVPATQFYMDSASPLAASSISQQAFSAGSMLSASMPIDISGSIFAQSGAGSQIGLPVIQPSANITGSLVFANAVVPKPTDADTSGSIECHAVWTIHTAHETAGSVFVIRAGMSYISSSALVRTAACTAACGTYNYTAVANWHTTDVGDLASWDANDICSVLTLCSDQMDAADTGGSGIAFAGVELRYTANTLGTAAGS